MPVDILIATLSGLVFAAGLSFFLPHYTNVAIVLSVGYLLIGICSSVIILRGMYRQYKK
ncbi:MAG: hypothetical protein LKH81_11050 [Acetobacter sp.]|jgi:F0F1-type ATP synthase assembly protein I|nr:hypothetical protein [Acetobacter sp.]MCH4062709.1 hypothetical protein [Acetobacter sp.]MCH4088445.1 hypothetical protein [Acetobacter sp.]MCI1295066.1 hypothetical protein [Acetobacter sp.]MCI1321115.1 hypothetical protein [Acetobacter sp.]